MQTSPPDWMKDFTDEVGSCLHPLNDTQLGCHFYLERGIWEVTLFFAATEVVGGKHDGVRRQAPFWVDVRALGQVFDLTELYWQSHVMDSDDALGSHLSIVGSYVGNSIWLRVLQNAPSELPAGHLAPAACGEILENW